MIESYECNSDAIILENIARNRFKSPYRMDVVPIQLLKVIISQLAKFHGLSFVLKHEKRDYFENKIETIKSPLHFDKNAWKDTNSEVVLIDYQFMFYASPIIDILYFIYTGTDGQLREAHMNELKDLYHTELTKFLQYFALNVNDIYPREVYEKDFQDSLDFGLMAALYVSPVIFTEEDVYPDFGKDDWSFKINKRHKERITQIVEEYLECGILN
ncbi:uncharacterized protein LOC112056622 [Bicyclus anynana]|uniref:Uncharacterized protein LOC112056622 n=1 Tax=Bicyclus anynana TaxID=110368 RepID=A0ABM3LS37_BICAN|nr:uncharacterized protein LOC112056622 [Bicyclus anynana]